MSEPSNGRGTDEMDSAFLALVDDVDTRSRPPGADRAVRTAGRRRAASVTAVAAVLALVVGVGGWALQDRASGGAPVVGVPSGSLSSSLAPSSSDDGVPTPALMNPQSLNKASKGWARWEQVTADANGVSTCTAVSTSAPQPPQETIQLYRTSGDGSAALRQSRFASVDDSNLAMRAAVEALDACPKGTTLFNQDFAADLEVVGITWRSGSRSGAVWVVNHGSRMDTFSVVGLTVPLDDIRSAVSELIAADVQMP